MKICVECMAEQRIAAGHTVDMDELKKEAKQQAQSANFGMRVSAYQEATKTVDELGLKSSERNRQKALVFARHRFSGIERALKSDARRVQRP